MIVSFYPLLLIIKKITCKCVSKIIKNKDSYYNVILDKNYFTTKLIHLFSALYLMLWGDISEKSGVIADFIVRAKDLVINTYIVVTITLLILAIINIAVDIYKYKPTAIQTPIELHAQIVRIFITICAILSILSLVLGISISSLFTGIGAAAALLTFVFKDTVLGILASLQLTFQNIIKVGDWVTLPTYNADGNIEKITITVVVIRNFDNTYTTVPTYGFLTTGVKNWRAMFILGGRRIKRAIILDIDTIKISNQQHLNKMQSLSCMQRLVNDNNSLFDAKNNIANVTIFRHYINQYLRHHQQIHQEGFTFLVRQLDPTPHGLPIEIYVFTKDTNWTSYEAIQADIFEHLLGVMSHFDLRSFQCITNDYHPTD